LKRKQAYRTKRSQWLIGKIEKKKGLLMLVYVQAIEVFAEKVGTIKIVAEKADHCPVDNHGVEHIHHVRVWQTIAYAEQPHHCAQYVSAFSFSLQCVSFSYW